MLKIDKDTIEFLKDLSNNNNKEWFDNNRSRYIAAKNNFEVFVQNILQEIVEFEPILKGLEAKSCIYRINRDIRFSNDKTPYKTNFGALIIKGGRKNFFKYPGYYLHIEPDNSIMGGGIWCPEPALLKSLRHDIYDGIEEFTGILEKKEFKNVYGELDGEMLKRMPEGFPKDCPYENIIKRKSFIVSNYQPEKFFYSDGWIDDVVENFRVLYPFNKFLNYTVGSFLGKV